VNKLIFKGGGVIPQGVFQGGSLSVEKDILDTYANQGAVFNFQSAAEIVDNLRPGKRKRLPIKKSLHI
jgi:hypothetical protein